MSRFTQHHEYAVTLFDGPSTPLRPLRAVYIGKHASGPEMAKSDTFEVHDPDDPLDFPERINVACLVVHGEWNHMAHPRMGAKQRTWADIAAEQMAHVQCQRDLAKRLTGIGIPRDPEPYWIKERTWATPVVDQKLILNFDEIDLLLRRGGA